MMTTTTGTTATTASTSSSFPSRSVSLTSLLNLYQVSPKGKTDESLNPQELLVESPDNSITIRADVHPSPSKSLHTTQSVPSTSDHILSQTISACSAASDAIEVAPEELLASPSSQQDAIMSADIRSSDTPKLVFENRDSSLTEFLYSNKAFVDAFPNVSMQPIPFTGALVLDVIKHTSMSNIFCVTSNIKCIGCKKKMTVYFSYQKDGKSYIYDLEKKEIVQPCKINDTFILTHYNCMGERTEEGRNNFFRIFEEKSHFLQRWRSIEWGTLNKILYFMVVLGLVTTTIYITIDIDIETGILSALWIFMILFMLYNIYLLTKVWRKRSIRDWRLTRESDIHLKLVIWKPSSISTVV